MKTFCFRVHLQGAGYEVVKIKGDAVVKSKNIHTVTLTDGTVAGEVTDSEENRVVSWWAEEDEA